MPISIRQTPLTPTMTDVASSHSLSAPRNPNKTASTKADKGTNSANQFDKLLRQCEAGAVEEAEAQKLVDGLDKASSDLPHRGAN